MAAENLVFLELDGVDTISEVEINDKTVGVTDNMFVKYRFDITGQIVVSRK